MARRKRSSAGSPRSAGNEAAGASPSNPRQSQLAPWQWFVICASVPIFVLSSRLTLDLWADEVYTLYDFAAQPVSTIVSDYSAPNNHVLYSLLLHPLAVRTAAEPLLRLPSLLCAIGALIILFRLAWRLSGPTAAVSATLALGLNLMFLTHAVQLRGYGLSMLFSAGLLELAVPRDKPNGAGRLLLIAALGAAFLYVIPSNAIFLAPLGAAAVVLAWRSVKQPSPLEANDHPFFSRRELLATAAAWLSAWPLALAAYWPILDQVRDAAGGAAAPLSPQALSALIGAVYWAAGHDLWPLAFLLPAIACSLAWLRRRQADADSHGPPHGWLPMCCLAVAMLAAPFALCWLLGTTPFVRNFCPLLPGLALVVGWLMSVALRPLDSAAATQRAPNAGAWIALAGLMALLLPQVLLYPGRLEAVRSQRFAQDGYYNYYAANFEPSRVALRLAQEIQPNEDFMVLYADVDQYNLGHYLARAGLPLPPLRLTDTASGRTQARLFCVVPELADWDRLAEIAGVPADELRSFPLVERAGYFRVYASPGPVEIERGTQNPGALAPGY